MGMCLAVNNQTVAARMFLTNTPSDALIDSLLADRIQHLNNNPHDVEHDFPFLVADTSRVFEQHQHWLRCLGTIKPFYGQSAAFVYPV